MGSDWTFSSSELQYTPSRCDGVSLTSELERRRSACRLIARLATALHVTLASQRSACVFLHRFYMRRSLTQCDEQLVAAACLFLACKAENDETQSVDVQRLARVLVKEQSSRVLQEVVSNILVYEGDVLLALSFELAIDHSYCYIGAEVDKVVALTAKGDAATSLQKKLKQVAWSFLNDSVSTLTCLAVDATLAAKAAVYAAGLFEGNVPQETVTAKGDPWWTVLHTSSNLLKDAARHVLSAYTAPYVETSVLPSALVELVSIFHLTAETDECCKSFVRGFEAMCKNDLEQVAIAPTMLFQSVEDSPTSNEAFVGQTTAWIDDYVTGQVKSEQSPSSPSDPSAVEMSIPLYSPHDRVTEMCTQGPLVQKRSASLAEWGHTIKKAKLAP